MIYNVSGKLTYTDAAFVVVECGGIGFKCHTTFHTMRRLPAVGGEVNLFTYLNVREDAMDLFGFYDQQELDCFKLLVSVSGIGPKAALSILSELTPDQLAISIASGDFKALTKAQGVGKKIAERAVLELKDKISGTVTDTNVSSDVDTVARLSAGGDAAEAVGALVSLGFSQSDASVTVSKLEPGLSVDEMIRQGLKILSRQV